jgi:hypothetical protein
MRDQSAPESTVTHLSAGANRFELFTETAYSVPTFRAHLQIASTRHF